MTVGSVVIGGLWAVRVFGREIRNFERTTRTAHYSELDKIYMDILVQALEKPYLRNKVNVKEYVECLERNASNPLRVGTRETKYSTESESQVAKTKTEPSYDSTALQAPEYAIYAYICMNFVETIRDRCHESRPAKRWWSFSDEEQPPDDDLRKTWQPIIGAECDLHNGWFRMEMDAYANGTPRKFCIGFCDFVISKRWESDALPWGDRDESEIKLAAC